MRALSSTQLGLVAERGRALGDPTRLRILETLAGRELAVWHIAANTGIQQSSISKHLRVLFQTGLVRRRREASTVFYWIADPGLLEYVRYLAQQVLGSTSGRAGRGPRV